jgi:hypothetical protein
MDFNNYTIYVLYTVITKMPFESFPTPPSEEARAPDTSEPTLRGTNKDRSPAESERFGWNDIIVPEDDIGVAEKIIRECGFEYASKVIPENRQYYGSDPQKETWDEFAISVTFAGSREPVDRETLKGVIAALRNGETHVVVRVARLAPGEHFG